LSGEEEKDVEEENGRSCWERGIIIAAKGRLLSKGKISSKKEVLGIYRSLSEKGRGAWS